MTAQFPGAPKHLPMALPFGKTNIANANGTLFALEDSTNEYVMPAAGSIFGFSGTLNGSLTTGTLTFQPTINGSLAPSFSTAVLHLNAGKNSAHFEARRANYTFNAGDVVGLIYQVEETVDPTSRDANALLFVLLESVDL